MAQDASGTQNFSGKGKPSGARGAQYVQNLEQKSHSRHGTRGNGESSQDVNLANGEGVAPFDQGEGEEMGQSNLDANIAGGDPR